MSMDSPYEEELKTAHSVRDKLEPTLTVTTAHTDSNYSPRKLELDPTLTITTVHND